MTSFFILQTLDLDPSLTILDEMLWLMIVHLLSFQDHNHHCPPFQDSQKDQMFQCQGNECNNISTINLDK